MEERIDATIRRSHHRRGQETPRLRDHHQPMEIRTIAPLERRHLPALSSFGDNDDPAFTAAVASPNLGVYELRLFRSSASKNQRWSKERGI